MAEVASDNEVSLVLSSGGARGLAHIGAIRALEEAGFDIRSVSGSSMGALVGGIYAAGKLNDYADWVTGLGRTDVIQLLDFGWLAGAGLFKGDKVISVLEDMVGDWQIEDLDVGFTAVATDLNRKREVWINSGSLFDAIRASIAIPLVFAPVQRGNQLLVDGGVLNPLPIATTLSNDTDLLIAIDVNGQDDRAMEVRMPIQTARDEDDDEQVEDEPRGKKGNADPATLRGKVVNFVDEMFKTDDKETVNRGMFDIATESMDAMQVTISRLKLSVYSPDLLVQIPRNVAHFFEFERAGELIDLGYKEMREALNAPPRP